MSSPLTTHDTDDLRHAFLAALQPPPPLTLSEWADRYFVLSPEASSEPGRWTTFAYQKGIMDAISDPRNRKVTMMKSARVGYTKVVCAAIGYHSHYDPCSILVLQPTEDDAKGFSTEEIQPMFRDSPALKGKLRGARDDGRSNRQTMLKMNTGAGTLTIAGAKSPRNFRRITVRKVFRDEIDAYEASAEGDPIALSAKRTQTAYAPQEVNGSTPTLKGLSLIEREFALSDQRRFYVPCPHCGAMQHLFWGGLEWPSGEPEKAVYVCQENGCVIDERHKMTMLAQGEWRAQAEWHGHAGFHINALYSPFPGARWGLLAREFLEAKAGGPSTLQVFVNTVLGETWDAGGEGVSSEGLRAHREEYPADRVPRPAVLVTAGVDIQDDRFEAEIVAWAPNDETWSLDYVRHYGDPASPGFWEALDGVLEREFEHESGRTLKIETACIDTGGSYTDHVYSFVRSRLKRRIFGIKGSSKFDAPIWPPKATRSLKKQVQIFMVGVSAAKVLTYGRFAVEAPGPGYCHFPTRYPDDYFDQLTAEKLVTRYKKGFPVRTWEKPDGARNEALDCRVYATAARMSMAVDLHRRANEFQNEEAGVQKPKAKATPRSSFLGGRSVRL